MIRQSAKDAPLIAVDTKSLVRGDVGDDRAKLANQAILTAHKLRRFDNNSWPKNAEHVSCLLEIQLAFRNSAEDSDSKGENRLTVVEISRVQIPPRAGGHPATGGYKVLDLVLKRS